MQGATVGRLLGYGGGKGLTIGSAMIVDTVAVVRVMRAGLDGFVERCCVLCKLTGRPDKDRTPPPSPKKTMIRIKAMMSRCSVLQEYSIDGGVFWSNRPYALWNDDESRSSDTQGVWR